MESEKRAAEAEQQNLLLKSSVAGLESQLNALRAEAAKYAQEASELKNSLQQAAYERDQFRALHHDVQTKLSVRDVEVARLRAENEQLTQNLRAAQDALQRAAGASSGSQGLSLELSAEKALREKITGELEAKLRDAQLQAVRLYSETEQLKSAQALRVSNLAVAGGVAEALEAELDDMKF